MPDHVPPPAVPPRTRRRVRLRAYAVPALTGLAVAATAVVLNGGSASAEPALPRRSAAQILVGIQHATATPFSGRVSETTDLGLPNLPNGDSPASLSWQSLLTGSHQAHVWYAGPTHVRLAMLGQLSEADVVRNGSDLWTYTSQTNTVTHAVVHRNEKGTPTGPVMTPSAAAAAALAAITPSTAVSVDSTRTVAGRAAYTLELRPRDAATTIRRITIAVDGVHYTPLQVEVFGSGTKPAVEVGFTQISFSRPAASVFAFTVPHGATVRTPSPAGHRSATSPAKVIGSGWTAVAELATPPSSSGRALSGELAKLTTPIGTTGMRLLSTNLINAVITPDGRVFAGAVSAGTIEAVAAKTPR